MDGQPGDTRFRARPDRLDAEGDLTGYDTFAWYVWQDGKYVPLESGAAKE